jgi:hypothetical protein
LLEHLIERGRLDLHGLRAAGCQVGVVREHAHAEGLGALGDLASDATEADDAERLPEQLDAGKALPVPGTGLHRGRGLRHGACPAQHVGEGELSGCDGVARGCVHHDHAALGRRLDVDIVDPDAGAPDHLELRGRGKHLGRDLGFRAHCNGVHVAHELEHLGR